MEKRRLVVTSIEEKDLGSGKKIYNCMTAGGTKYSCWSAKIKDFLNKEAEFDVFSKQNGEYVNWYIKLEDESSKSGNFGGKRPFVPSFKDSRESAILSAKTMTLSYCKDIVSALANSAQIKKDDVWTEVKKGYETLLPLLALDSIKEPAQSPQSHPQEPALTHTLKPVLITILKAKMAKMNFRSADMVDFAGGMCGIELKRDNGKDEIIWDISDEDANKLIAAMA